MKYNLKRIFLNKHTIIIAVILIIYFLSWFFFIGHSEYNSNLISGKRVKVYWYFNSPIQKLNYIIMNLNGKNLGAEIVDGEYLINFAHYFYHPLELASNYFGFQYISEFYKTNMLNLAEFNSSSEERKLKQYDKFKKYHSTIFGNFNSENIDEFKIRAEAYSKNYNIASFLMEEFFISDENKKGNLNKRHNHDWSNDRFFYNFSDYEKTVLEGRKFTKWFNQINITTNNPSFDKEFVDNYWLYISKKENR